MQMKTCTLKWFFINQMRLRQAGYVDWTKCRIIKKVTVERLKEGVSVRQPVTKGRETGYNQWVDLDARVPHLHAPFPSKQ